MSADLVVIAAVLTAAERGLDTAGVPVEYVAFLTDAGFDAGGLVVGARRGSQVNAGRLALVGTRLEHHVLTARYSCKWSDGADGDDDDGDDDDDDDDDERVSDSLLRRYRITGKCIQDLMFIRTRPPIIACRID